KPDEADDQLPAALDKVERLSLPIPNLAFHHLSGSSHSTSNGKRRGMASRLNFPHETIGQLVRFAIVGFSLAAVYSAIYWYLATYVIVPVPAVIIGFLVSVSPCFVV